ncbi:MAG TPA: hypothetical protein VFQ67_18000 [Allosphingosinicella sp.]|jgi:hypothetical protein|nr:hypothetical protein [Allosphingosinicella sp.]
MGWRNYEWDPRPPTFRERLLAGLFLAIFLPVQASWYVGWRLFGDYDGKVAAGVTLVGLVLIFRILPGVKRIEG